MAAGLDPADLKTLVFEVLKTTRWVADKSSRVRIDQEAIVRFTQKILVHDSPKPSWDSIHHYQGEKEKRVASLFVLDTLNFCFWPLPGKPLYEVSCRPTAYSGY